MIANKLVWKEGMMFDGIQGAHVVPMDASAPIGRGAAATPKELVVMGLAGCTAMDVVALLRKHKQPLEGMEVESNVETSSGGYPVVFTAATITFKLKGAIDPKIALEAVMLSQTKYCGVSAMLSKAFPIQWRVLVNEVEAGSGTASFL